MRKFRALQRPLRVWRERPALWGRNTNAGPPHGAAGQNIIVLDSKPVL
ncbi:hypothetical protein [Sinorhizobium mexicanum]|nr:hypothetical protein [Sinorhizobium mexicanum]MBP1884225.1 hypothetical protein [Sinorhizobium mexicanum]